MNLKKNQLQFNNLDIIIIGIIIVILGLVALLFFYDETIPRNKIQTHITGELGIATWILAYNFESTSYTAKNDIHLKITAEPLRNYMETHPERFKQVETLQIHIPDSYVGTPEYQNGRLLSNVVVLRDDSGNGVFEGEETIQFDTGGQKCVLVKENERLESSVRTCEGRDSLIEISDSERLFELRMDKAIFLLSLLFSIGIVIQIRNWIVSMGTQDFDEQKKKMINVKPSKFIPMRKHKNPKKSNPNTPNNPPIKENPTPEMNHDPKS